MSAWLRSFPWNTYSHEIAIADDAKRAFEPVFSVDDDVALQTFSSVFRENLDDPALLNAILLTATFAVAGGVLNQEGLRYQTQAMKSIRKRIDHSVDTVTTSTLGAMLLLAGVEVRSSLSYHPIDADLIHTDAPRYETSSGAPFTRGSDSPRKQQETEQ